jgi:hypothetical protein
MKTRHWLSLAVVVLVVSVLTFGSGYWAQARQHMENEHGHMMNKGHDGQMMGKEQHQGMMQMPMMHTDMSQEDMNQFCSRMQKRHESMQSMRQKNTEKLNSLVQSMKQARGTDKIESMEQILVELVDQHNKRGSMMMGSMRSMMGSMMGMHRMSDQQRQRMMKKMQDCPMMQGMMNSGKESGSHKESEKDAHHE